MAATKKVNILLALKDQFTKPLKNTTAEVKKQQKQIKAATNVINSWAKNANNKFRSVCGVAGKVGAAFLTLGGVISVANIKSWATDAMEGFNAAHEAETKLEAVLNNVPSIIAKGAGAAAAAKDNLVALTDKLEETGVVAAAGYLPADGGEPIKAGSRHGGSGRTAKGAECHPRRCRQHWKSDR